MDVLTLPRFKKVFKCSESVKPENGKRWIILGGGIYHATGQDSFMFIGDADGQANQQIAFVPSAAATQNYPYPNNVDHASNPQMSLFICDDSQHISYDGAGTTQNISVTYLEIDMQAAKPSQALVLQVPNPLPVLVVNQK